MKSDFELILEECLAQMRVGKALEECLSAHPAQAKRLRPLLGAAVRVWEIPIPRARAEAVQAGRERLLAEAKFRAASPSPVSSGRFSRYTKQVLCSLQIALLGRKRSSLNLALTMAAIFVIVLLATGSLTVNASASSLPGDSLYGVKRSWENVRLSMTPSQQGRQRLQEQYDEERRDEVKELIHLRRAETVEFQAPLKEMDAEHWQVDGFWVQIDSETEVEGEPETGLALYIRARLDEDGTLTALQVRIPARNQLTPFPTGVPTPGLTPQMDENPETEGSETRQSPEFKPAEENEENEETVQPTQPPGHDATQTPQPHKTRTPEPTDRPEVEHTPEPTENHELTHTPESTEQHLKTPEPTKEH